MMVNPIDGIPPRQPPYESEYDGRLRKPDIVNHPQHYTAGAIECIEAIEAMGIGAEFCRGNAVKYLWRLGKKGDDLEQARKCKWYVDRLVSILERKAND